MARLRRSDRSKPGISRRRRGRGFSYAYPDGHPVTEADVLERIRALAVPPAWDDVWICPWSNGHIQAVGTDVAGRRQYLYHDQWRADRDRAKFDRVQDFATRLPKLRASVRRDLTREGLCRERVLAAIVRLLDVGFFRVGGEEYAHEHETFGVASLRKEHVHIRDGAMVFKYPAKGALVRRLEIRDAQARRVVTSLLRRRSGGANLFVYKRGREWCEVHAPDVNDYIKAAMGEEFTAKDFRTWSATVLAAEALAEHEPTSESTSGRRRAVAEAVATVAQHLGNTPAVSRSSYIDPRVVDSFHDGETIRGTHGPKPQRGRRRGHTSPGGDGTRAREVAVLHLLDEDDARGRPKKA